MASWGATLFTPAWCWAVLMNPASACTLITRFLGTLPEVASAFTPPVPGGVGGVNPAGKGTSCLSPSSLPLPGPGHPSPQASASLPSRSSPHRGWCSFEHKSNSHSPAGKHPGLHCRGSSHHAILCPPVPSGFLLGPPPAAPSAEPIKGLRGSRCPSVLPGITAFVGHCAWSLSVPLRSPPPHTPQTPTGGSCEKLCLSWSRTPLPGMSWVLGMSDRWAGGEWEWMKVPPGAY